MPAETSHLGKKLNTFVQLSAAELSCLADLQSTPVRVKSGKEIVHEGQTGHKAYILQAGWALNLRRRDRRGGDLRPFVRCLSSFADDDRSSPQRRGTCRWANRRRRTAGSADRPRP